MNARALIAQLASEGVTLQNEAGRLKVNALQPLDAQVLAEVKAHKADILRVLSTASTCNADFNVGAAYDPALATAYARKMYRRGRITAQQCESLLAYANAAADSQANHTQNQDGSE